MIQKLFPSRGLPAPSVEVRRSVEDPSVSFADPIVWQSLGAGVPGGPMAINQRTAMRVLAVYACVRIISEAVASLPLLVYRRLPRGKERASDHPVYTILHDRPNPEVSAFTLREMLMAHVLTWGNAYCEIQYNQAGTVTALWPLLPDRTRVERVNGARKYYTRLPDGTEQPLRWDQVLHIPGLSFDGLMGYAPIELAKRSISLTAAVEQFGDDFFRRGTNLSGVLSHPKTLSKPAKDRLREDFENNQSGLSNSHRIALLEEGLTWTQTSVPANHAQFIETRKFQVADIARLFRVPPHMLADLESGASYASVEQMSLDFVTYTLRPWLVRWEQILTYDLFGARERQTVFVEHLVDGLLRGDIQSRYNAYAVGRQWGWLSADDIREYENLNPLPNGGDVYLVPLNMVPADQAGQTPTPGAAAPPNAPPTEPPPPDGQRALFLDAGERMVKRLVPQLRKLAKQGDARATQAADALILDQRDAFASSLVPMFDAILHFGPPEFRALAAGSRALATELATRHLESLRSVDVETLESSGAASFADVGLAFVANLLTPARRVA